MSLLDGFDPGLLAHATPAELAELERHLRQELADLGEAPDPDPTVEGHVVLEALAETPGALAATLTGGREIQRPHLDLIDQVLVKAAEVGRQRVIVCVGPRYGKSRRGARWGSAWRLHQRPDTRIIIATHTAGLAEGHSRWVRDLLENHDLGIKPRRDTRSVGEWYLDGYDGGILAAGIGGAITGFGADVLLIDDVIKDAEQAASATWREKVWRWYTETAFDRLEPNASVVIINTRWDADDLTGRLLREQPGVWTVIRVPTVAEAGDPLGRVVGELLWPERYDAAAVAEQQATLGPYAFSARHQQNPIKGLAGLWEQAWIDAHRVKIGEVPTLVSTLVSVDPSGSSKATGAECGVAVIGLGLDGDAYLLDDWSLRGTPDQWGTAAVRAALEWQAQTIVVEDNYGGEQTEFVIRTAMRNLARTDMRLHHQQPPQVVPVNAMGAGKLVRAEPVAALAAAGRIHHVDHGEDLNRFAVLEEQLTSWSGAGPSPDRLDAYVHGVRALLMPREVKSRHVQPTQRWAAIPNRR